MTRKITAGTQVVVSNLYGTETLILESDVLDNPEKYQTGVKVSHGGDSYRFQTEGRIRRFSDYS